MIHFLLLLLISKSYALEITDFRGKAIDISKTPHRIAALIPNLAEMVDSFGKADSLVGIPEFTVLAKKKSAHYPKNLGPYNRLSVETVLSTNPDLVIASIDGNDAGFIEKLESLKIPVFVFDTSSLDAIEKTVLLMEKVLQTKTPEKVHTLLTTLQNLKKQPHPRKKTIFIQIGWDPIISISKKTFIGELVEKLGFENITADSILKYPHSNAEEVLKQNPDVLVICQLTRENTEVEKAVRFWKQFKKLKAVQKNRIYVLSGDILLKPGVSLLEGISELNRIQKQ